MGAGSVRKSDSFLSEFSLGLLDCLNKDSQEMIFMISYSDLNTARIYENCDFQDCFQNVI